MILVSTDGTAWADKSQGSATSAITALGFGNGTFVAVLHRLGPEGILYSSDNGASWAGHDLSEGYNLSAIAFGNNSFVAVGSGGTILQSDRVAVAPVLSVQSTANHEGFQLGIAGELGQVCRLQATSGFPTTNWIDLGTVTIDQAVVSFKDRSATNFTSRFYRVLRP